MRLLLAAATALILIPVSASAAAWYLFYEDADTSWYVDGDSISKSGQWTNVARYTRNHKVSPRTGVKAAKASIAIDCRRRVYKMTRLETFDAAGKSLGAVNNPEGGQEHENEPGSANEAMIKFACGNDRAGKASVADPSRD
ncbi:MAG: surface-adhesin E family protein [Sphingomonas sp.]